VRAATLQNFNAKTQRRRDAEKISLASLRLCAFALKPHWTTYGLMLVLFAMRLSAQQVHFAAFDIFVDSKNVPLAAYQLEFSSPAKDVSITGIEGGEHEAFKTPPFYDPKAIQQERVILAAFNSAPASKLPTGKIRVATIHLQFKGPQKPDFVLKPQTAADPAGKSISIKTSFTERGRYE